MSPAPASTPAGQLDDGHAEDTRTSILAQPSTGMVASRTG